MKEGSIGASKGEWVGSSRPLCRGRSVADYLGFPHKLRMHRHFLSPALALGLLLAGSAAARAGPNGARAGAPPALSPAERQIVSAVLREPRFRTACVASRTTGAPFALQGASPAGSSFRWRASGARIMSPEQMAALNADAQAYLESRPEPGRARPITADLLAPGMRLVGGRAACAQTARLSAPAITGSTAFVSASFNCLRLCASGATYALRRRQRTWVVVAESFDWQIRPVPH
jgi:hypothetical protein